MDAFIEAAKQAGIPENPDYNGASQEGVAYFQLTIRNGLRCSAAKAYLAPAKGRPNLRIETDALTQRLLLDGRRIIGVAYSQGGAPAHRPRRGARSSSRPAPSARPISCCSRASARPRSCRRKEIEVRHDLAGRRQASPGPLSGPHRLSLPAAHHPQRRQQQPLATGSRGPEWALFRQGPLTVGAGVVALFWKTREELASPDVQFHVIPFSAKGPGQPLHDFPGYTVSVCQLRPESRGELTLRDRDPASHARDPPQLSCDRGRPADDGRRHEARPPDHGAAGDPALRRGRGDPGPRLRGRRGAARLCPGLRHDHLSPDQHLHDGSGRRHGARRRCPPARARPRRASASPTPRSCRP